MSKMQHHSYTFSFLLIFLIFRCTISKSTLSSTESLTISSNTTLVSPGDKFELGFFKPSSSNSRWYLGIWYKIIPDRTYIWVANRDTPLSNAIGTLRLLNTNLLLLDHSDTPVWSTNISRVDVKSPLVAELLANGNFVIRYSGNNDPSRFLWQSFDFPTDTLLPQMELGKDFKTGLNRFLTAWKSPSDPSSGNVSYKLKTQGCPEFFIDGISSPTYRSGPWDGLHFSGMPERRQLQYIVNNFTENLEKIAYTFLMTNDTIYSRLTIVPSGSFDRFTWISTLLGWTISSTSPKDECDQYKFCGYFSYCDMNSIPKCICIEGFIPRNPQLWKLGQGLGGCVRRTQLSCGGDEFLTLKNIKLPDTRTAVVYRRMDLKGCKQICFKNCNCTAFANRDIRNGGSGCVIWTGTLVDIRKFATEGQDLYVRSAGNDIEKKRNPTCDNDRMVVLVLNEYNYRQLRLFPYTYPNTLHFHFRGKFFLDKIDISHSVCHPLFF